MFTLQVITQLTRLDLQDIRFVLVTILDAPGAGVVTSGEFMALLVYDLLKSCGFQMEQLVPILKHFKEEFYECGRGCEAQKMVKSGSLVIADNRYVSINSKPIAYDLIEMREVSQLPVPVVSLAIVLPMLYQRAVSALKGPACPRAAEAVQPPAVSGRTI